MAVASNFFLAFFFSFIGSIPPGTINLTAIQLGLENRFKTALRFSAAAAIAEYPYAWLAIKFEKLITSSPVILDNIQLAGSIIMIVIGIVNLWPSAKNPSEIKTKFSNSGFRRGLFLGVLNPLAVPYWIGITAYLHAQRWATFHSSFHLHSYLIGVVTGAFLILVAFASLGKKAIAIFSDNPWIPRIPGITLLAIGFYTLALYYIS